MTSRTEQRELPLFTNYSSTPSTGALKKLAFVARAVHCGVTAPRSSTRTCLTFVVCKVGSCSCCGPQKLRDAVGRIPLALKHAAA